MQDSFPNCQASDRRIRRSCTNNCLLKFVFILALAVASEAAQSNSDSTATFVMTMFSEPTIVSAEVKYRYLRERSKPSEQELEKRLDQIVDIFCQEGQIRDAASLTSGDWEQINQRLDEYVRDHTNTNWSVRTRASNVGSYTEFYESFDASVSPHLIFATPEKFGSAVNETYRYEFTADEKYAAIQKGSVSPPLDVRNFYRLGDQERKIFQTLFSNDAGTLDTAKLDDFIKTGTMGSLVLTASKGDLVDDLETEIFSFVSLIPGNLKVSMDFRVLANDPSILVDMTVFNGSDVLTVQNRNFRFIEALGLHIPFLHTSRIDKKDGVFDEKKYEILDFAANVSIPDALFQFQPPVGATIIDERVDPPLVTAPLDNSLSSLVKLGVDIDSGPEAGPERTKATADAITEKAISLSKASGSLPNPSARIWTFGMLLLAFSAIICVGLWLVSRTRRAGNGRT